MTLYTSTPDYYNEYLQHGVLHKYIERWKGKNGKWHYKYAKGNKSGRISSTWESLKSAMRGDPRYTTASRRANKSAMSGDPRYTTPSRNSWRSSMIGDSRYKDMRKGAMGNDPRYKRGRAKSAARDAMAYDPRFERQGSGISSQDSRYKDIRKGSKMSDDKYQNKTKSRIKKRSRNRNL